jgi:hypothetical protein
MSGNDDENATVFRTPAIETRSLTIARAVSQWGDADDDSSAPVTGRSLLDMT